MHNKNKNVRLSLKIFSLLAKIIFITGIICFIIVFVTMSTMFSKTPDLWNTYNETIKVYQITALLLIFAGVPLNILAFKLKRRK